MKIFCNIVAFKRLSYRYLIRKVYDKCFELAGFLPVGVCIVIKSKKCGFFGDLTQTLNAIRFAEQAGIDCQVCWDKRSLYFDERQGSNVWDYYFKNSRFTFSRKRYRLNFRIAYYPSAFEFPCYPGLSVRDSTSFAISRFCILRQYIIDDIESYIQENFTPTVLGVHYRGTDVIAGKEGRSAPSDDQLVRLIKEKLSTNQFGSIFLASDDSNAVETLSEAVGSFVHFKDCLRSIDGNSIHGHYDKGLQGSGYQKGYEVLVDACILSRCDVLLHGGSGVVWFASSKETKLILCDVTMMQ